MDGYSVTEAASVLGVPTERVWELLARGVLSGAPEGESGMRVFLQPRPQPTTPVEDQRRPNGGGTAAEPEREASPFRELLTEFRSLTERYGQALLALGESRGEVASLRSRVDLLEARMDLRLPVAGGSSAPWPAAAAAVQREAPAPAADVVEPPAEQAEEEEHRARPRGPRRATESFAEALARAEDPSAAELPAAAAAGDPLAVSRADVPAAAEPSLPRELPPAETVPVADEPAPPEPTPEAATAEPPPPAESAVFDDLAELEAPSGEPGAAAEAVATLPDEGTEEPVAVEVVPEPVAVDAANEPVVPLDEAPVVAVTEPATVDREAGPPQEPTVAVEPDAEGPPAEDATVAVEPDAEEPAAEVAETDAAASQVGAAPADAAAPSAPELESAPEPPQPQPEPMEEPAVEPGPVDEDHAGGPEPAYSAGADTATPDAEPAAMDFDADRYTTAIEDPDWFEAEVEAAPAPAGSDLASDRPTEPEPAAEAERVPELDPEPAVDAAEPEAHAEPELEPQAESEPEPAVEAPEPEAEADSELALEAEHAAEREPEPERRTEPEPWPGADELDPPRQQAPDAGRASAEEETMLWFGRPAEPSGADEMEVASASGSAQPQANAEPPVEPEAGGLPGSRELDEAMLALEELTRRTGTRESGVPDEWPPPSVGLAEPTPAASTSEPAGTLSRPSFGTARPGSPATRAYRRLRRIFPG